MTFEHEYSRPVLHPRVFGCLALLSLVLACLLWYSQSAQFTAFGHSCYEGCQVDADYFLHLLSPIF
jgi:hypothetical protein